MREVWGVCPEEDRRKDRRNGKREEGPRGELSNATQILPETYNSLAPRTPPPLPCISIPLPCVLRSVGSGMDDLNVFGSVGNRKLLLLLIVSSSLLRDVHLAEFPSEDEDSEGRGGCCGQDVRCSSEPPVSSLLYSLEVEGSFKRGCMYRCMYRAIKFLESHAYRLIDS